jgi:hypothetical protein
MKRRKVSVGACVKIGSHFGSRAQTVDFVGKKVDSYLVRVRLMHG